MHITILVLYGFTIYFSAIAYSLITGNFNLSYVVFSGPLIISGCVAIMGAFDYLCWSITERVRIRAAKRGRVL